jgi:signal transduction histidine kinase
MNTDTPHHSGSRVQSTSWVIDARWYYAFLGYALGVIIPDRTSTQYPIAILSVAFLLVLASNVYFSRYLRQHGEAITDKQLDILNRSQVAIDLVFFFVAMLLTSGGVGNAGHSFFFIPIVISMILFGFQGAIIVAVVSGILVFLSVLVHFQVFNMFLMHETFVMSSPLFLALAHAAIIFLLYLLIGFFGGYMARLLNARDQLLLEQIKKENEHVERLEALTKEFDQSAKLLVRRDLQLSGANEKLTQLDQMKSEIISIVAHQLRTPLSAIKWTLKILIDEDVGKINPEQRELLEKGFESNERMIGLVNDVLAVDRLESGKLKYEFVPVQFEEIVQDMIHNLLPLATQNNIRVEFSSPEQLLPKIKIDPDKMHDVLQNLIDNAIKYTKSGGVVAVGVAMDGNLLHFWVKDNGIGIPEEEKEKIFSRFFRAGNAVRTKTDGSGLGLFIAQSVVKRHGGEVWFESVVDVGTTFHVTLPFTQ